MRSVLLVLLASCLAREGRMVKCFPCTPASRTGHPGKQIFGFSLFLPSPFTLFHIYDVRRVPRSLAFLETISLKAAGWQSCELEVEIRYDAKQEQTNTSVGQHRAFVCESGGNDMSGELNLASAWRRARAGSLISSRPSDDDADGWHR